MISVFRMRNENSNQINLPLFLIKFKINKKNGVGMFVLIKVFRDCEIVPYDFIICGDMILIIFGTHN